MKKYEHLKEIKQCVSFVFIIDGKGNYIPNGTGFFIGISHKDIEGYFIYFVTAKHVIQDAEGLYYESIALRLNKKDGTSGYIDLDTDNLIIHTHDNPDVDIVVFNFNLDGGYDFIIVPDDDIIDKDFITENEIAEGDDIFFAGLFTSHVGQKRIQPIIRFGKVALMSDEKIEWLKNDGEPAFLDLYLMECNSFGGNSGSPVFFQLNPDRDTDLTPLGVPPQILLAGIMKGTFLKSNKVQLVTLLDSLYSYESMGIAAITPSYQLKEIVDRIRNEMKIEMKE